MCHDFWDTLYSHSFWNTLYPSWLLKYANRMQPISMNYFYFLILLQLCLPRSNQLQRSRCWAKDSIQSDCMHSGISNVHKTWLNVRGVPRVLRRYCITWISESSTCTKFVAMMKCAKSQQHFGSELKSKRKTSFAGYDHEQQLSSISKDFWQTPEYWCVITSRTSFILTRSETPCCAACAY